MKKFMVFDPSTITEKQLQRVKAITKKESFNYEHQKKISECSAAISKWILFVVKCKELQKAQTTKQTQQTTQIYTQESFGAKQNKEPEIEAQSQEVNYSLGSNHVEKIKAKINRVGAESDKKKAETKT